MSERRRLARGTGEMTTQSRAPTTPMIEGALDVGGLSASSLGAQALKRKRVFQIGRLKLERIVGSSSTNLCSHDN